MRWPKYQSFNISPSNEYSGLISFKIDWFDLCCPRDCQETSPAPQFESINSLALCLFYGLAFTIYLTTGKTTALTIWIFVSKVMSLLSLPRFVIDFLPRSNRLLISWLQSPSAVILGPKKRKSVTVSTFSPSICYEVKVPDLHFLIFSFKLAFSLSFFTLIKRFFSSSSLSAFRMVSSAYLKLLIFLSTILIPACNSSSLAFLMICSAYKLNKQGDNGVVSLENSLAVPQNVKDIVTI